MKRLIVLVFALLFGLALFSSCKTSNCPAYSQVVANVEQPA